MTTGNTAARDDFPERPAALTVASFYASRGWRVLPLNGKAPRTPHGFKDATIDPDRIRKWLQRWPEANIGIATGSASGIIVLDIDARNGGLESLAQLEKEHGSLPQTVKVKTGDGFHLYFEYPGGHIPCRTNIRPGIDVKADGGYVVAPPSLHPNGARYKFASDPSRLADAPQWLVNVIQPAKANGAQAHLVPDGASRSSVTLDEIHISDRIKQLIRDGDVDGKYPSRSEAVFAAIRAMVKAGCNDEPIRAVLLDPAYKLSEKPREKGEAWLQGEIRRAREKPDTDQKQASVHQRRNQPVQQPTEVRCLADVEPEEVDWLWHPYLPIGKVTVIDGDPGVGKSWLTAAIAADLSKGRKLPGGSSPDEPQRVLMLTAEDGLGDTLRPRLDALGADLNLIYGKESSWELDDKGLEQFREIIAEVKPVLVVMDPLVAFMGSKVDMHKANQVRPFMAGLANIARDHSVAIAMVRHMTKGKRDKALYRGLGSIDITAACRSALMVGQGPDGDEQRIIAHTKSNLARKGPSLSYTIKDGKFDWTGEVDITAEDLCREAEDTEVTSARQEAAEFLVEELKDGPVPQKAIVQKAEELGIAKRTLDRAKKPAGVKSRKVDGAWVWQLER